MLKRTCVFGYTQRGIYNREQLRERQKKLNRQNENKGGVRPLSRLHPAHPVRKDAMSIHEPLTTTQKFMP